MRDRRKEQRWPAYLGATIEFGRGLATAACMVRNASGSGAKLQLREAAFIPEEFELSVPQREMAYRVRQRWRREGEVGVEIESVRMDATSARLRRGKRMKQLREENAALRRRLADFA